MHDGCVSYNDYHQSIETTYFNRLNFPFPPLSNNTLAALDGIIWCAWFGCCPSGRIPSDDYGIPTCNSIDVTRSAVGLSQAANRWKQMRTHAPKRREFLPFKILPTQISSRDARFIFFLYTGAVVWPLLLDTDAFRQCFTWVFTIRWPRQKGLTYANTCLPRYIMGPVYLSANYAWNTWCNLSPMMQRHDPICWIWVGTPNVELKSINIFPFISQT